MYGGLSIAFSKGYVHKISYSFPAKFDLNAPKHLMLVQPRLVDVNPFHLLHIKPMTIRLSVIGPKLIFLDRNILVKLCPCQRSPAILGSEHLLVSIGDLGREAFKCGVEQRKHVFVL